MQWFKKILSASILTSLFFIAPQKAYAEMPCDLQASYGTGGYNLMALVYDTGSACNTCAQQLPVYEVSSCGSSSCNSGCGSSSCGEGCGSFSGSCGKGYASPRYQPPVVAPLDMNLVGTINQQLAALDQAIGALTGTPSALNPVYPGPNPYTPSYPFNGDPWNTPPTTNPTTPTNPNIFTINYPTTGTTTTPTTTLPPYGGCDNIVIPCPVGVPGIPVTTTPTTPNYFPPVVTTPVGTTPVVIPQVFPTYDTTSGPVTTTPDRNRLPRGITHR